MSNDFKAFMSIEEVSELLCVNYQLIYRQIRCGALRASRIGRVYRIARADLQEYLEKTKAEGFAEGTECSVCGRTYLSATSFPGSCKKCCALICTDCWMRVGTRFCSEHQQGA